ncbi:transmembrane amino acid transporter protein [Cryptosporidium andersoni]|uniref:Transmembrane amino acid transporter protein n=1 Tax=Cryptosporidium andersoni TaxID=117008 RepID=A0A1J4MV80_9CRYT|nr:transmembrane amino acid transporter protein [Cryptosporidium andersoni]
MSILGKNSFLSTCLLLISAATGMGILTLPWAFLQTGLILGLIILVYWSILCGSTIYILIMAGIHYNVGTITELLYHSITGEIKIPHTEVIIPLNPPKMKTRREKIAEQIVVICDMAILIDCLFMIPCLLIFLSDFVVPLTKLVQTELPLLAQRNPGLKDSKIAHIFYYIFMFISKFFTERYRCVIFFCIIVFFLCLPNDFTAVRFASFLSVISTVSTSLIITYRYLGSSQPPQCDGTTIRNINPHYCSKGNTKLFNIDTTNGFWGLCSISNIVLFSYFCHLVLLPITKNIRDFSSLKIKGIVVVFALVIASVNSTVGMTGYAIFKENTLPNVINNFLYNDPLVVCARIYLTLALTVTICMETLPLSNSVASLIIRTYKVIKRKVNQTFVQTNIEIEDKLKLDGTNALGKSHSHEDDLFSTAGISTNASTIQLGNVKSHLSWQQPTNIENSNTDQYKDCCKLKKFCCNVPRKFSARHYLHAFNLIMVLTFAGILAVSFSSVAKLIQVTGGTLDGIFVLLIPAWVYYSTFFYKNNKIFGGILIALYIFHFCIASISGIMALFINLEG